MIFFIKMDSYTYCVNNIFGDPRSRTKNQKYINIVTKFLEDVQIKRSETWHDYRNNIINLYNKPIWVTEFAPQTISSSQSQPNLYTQQEVNDFINTVIPWMNSNPMVERYAWRDSKSGTSAIFTIDGQLTETGITYRDAQ